jgi:hypothetical protein
MKRLHLRVAVFPNRQTPPLPVPATEADLEQAWTVIDPDVVAGTEFSHQPYRRPWVAAARRHGAKTFGRGQGTPIASRMKVRWSLVKVLHDGLALVTPARKNVTARLDAAPVLIIAKHTVSNAFPAKHPKHPIIGLAARVRFWFTDQAKTRRRISRANRHGVTAVVLGDLNIFKPPQYGPNELVAARDGLIWILVYPAPGHVVKTDQGPWIPDGRRFGDHPAIAADLTIISDHDPKVHR